MIKNRITGSYLTFCTFCLLCFCSNGLLSQQVEIQTGISINSMSESFASPSFINTFTSSQNFNLRAEYQSKSEHLLAPRYGLEIGSYSSEIKFSDGGMGGGYQIVTEAKRTFLSFSFMPLNFIISKRISLNLGIDYSFSMSQSYPGTFKSYSLATPSSSPEDLEKKYDSLINSSTFGLRMSSAYFIPINDTIHGLLRYSFYRGLSREFISQLSSLRVSRHYVHLGVRHLLGSTSD